MRFAALVAAFVMGATAQAQFNRIIVFGDSLSDMGNISAGTLGVQPGSSYFQGRFSNGNVWIERLATRTGITLTRSGASGTNWAFGGAQSGTGTFGFLFFQFPNVSTQVTRYLNTNPSITNQNLFVVWCGANDYFEGQTNTNTVVTNVENIIRSLHTRGARQFLVPNLPLLGNIPRFIGTADQASMNARTQQHNAQLSARLQTLRATLAGITIAEMDTATDLSQIQSTPGAWGFTNVTQTALVNSTVVPNPDQYLFFDDVHPTRIGHQLVSERAFDSVSPAVSVQGQFSFNQFFGSPDTLVANVEVWRNNAKVETLQPVSIQPNGTYQFAIKRNGSYSLRFRIGQFLARRINVNLTGQVQLNLGFSNGDADLSGEVDAADVDTVIERFGATLGDSHYLPAVDLDGSSETDAADVDVVIANFGLSDQ